MESSTSTVLSCASALSTQPRSDAALHEAASAARVSLGGGPDFAVVFLSPHHAAHVEQIADAACQLLGTTNLLGCTGESIAGTALEVEEAPALSLWLAPWPRTRITPIHLQFERTPEGGALK